MTDYAEEKSAELEILESIYSETYHISKSGKTFSVILRAEEDEDDHEARQIEKFGVPSCGIFSLKILFSHPEKYPDEPLIFNLENVDEDGDLIARDADEPEPEWLSNLSPLIQEQIDENLGEQQAFIVTSFVQEYLTDTCEELNKIRRDRIYELEEEAENAHTKKLIGTPVTLETFTQWQIKFQLEMKELFDKKQSELEKAQAGRIGEVFVAFSRRLRPTGDLSRDLGSLPKTLPLPRPENLSSPTNSPKTT